MRNLLILVFLVGLVIISCISPPDPVKPVPEKVQFAKATNLQASASVFNVQDITALPSPDTPAPTKGWVDFFKGNAITIIVALMAFLKVVVNLTPTQTDNNIFGILDTLINLIIPNRKAGGGTFASKDG